MMTISSARLEVRVLIWRLIKRTHQIDVIKNMFNQTDQDHNGEKPKEDITHNCWTNIINRKRKINQHKHPKVIKDRLKNAQSIRKTHC